MLLYFEFGEAPPSTDDGAVPLSPICVSFNVNLATHSSSGGEVRTAEEVWAAEENGIFAAFPDVHATTESMIAEDDQVFVRWTITGTHEWEFHGVEPTGNEVEYAEWAVYRIENRQVAEAWWLGDGLDLFGQLDAIQPPTD